MTECLPSLSIHIYCWAFHTDAPQAIATIYIREAPMLNRWFVISFALVGSACGTDSGIENAVKERLKDPSSVQFKQLHVSASAKRACVVWNARNSMGGYGDWEVAELQKVESEWVVMRMTRSQASIYRSDFFVGDCTDDNMKAFDQRQAAEQKAKEVISSLQERAAKGDAEAEYRLAISLTEGKGIKKDTIQALGWLQKSASQGHADAQFFLASMYLLGQNVPRDMVLGDAWLNLAISGGNANAIKFRGEVESGLSPATLSEAKNLASTWKKGQGLSR